MKEEIKFIGFIGSCILIYFIYIFVNPNYVSGPVDAQKFVRRAVEEKDSTICNKIKVSSLNIVNTEASLEALCKYRFSKRFMDENLCPNEYKHCKQEVVELRNYLVECGEKTGKDADTCYEYIAFETYDLEFCSKILDVAQKDHCEKFVTTYYYIDKWDQKLGRVVLD